MEIVIKLDWFCTNLKLKNYNENYNFIKPDGWHAKLNLKNFQECITIQDQKS